MDEAQAAAFTAISWLLISGLAGVGFVLDWARDAA